MKSGLLSVVVGAVMVSGTMSYAAPPNIIFILADDQRSDELGCVNPLISTPSIDRLAGEGVRFSNAFVSTPICMCSRASIFTGLTARTHQWTPGAADSRPVNDPMLATSFPCLLREAGYSTGFFGKNHVKFSGGLNPAYDRMFDQWEIIFRNPYFKKMPDGTLRHTAELIGDRSSEFIKAQSADRPFFLYMSFNVAHAEDSDHRPGIGQYPWPRAVDGMYEDRDIPEPGLNDSGIYDALPEFIKASLNRTRWFWRWDTPDKYTVNMKARFRMISGMDRVIGRVMDVLEQQGLAENTVIIYSADNGVYRGDRSLAGKWLHFDESLCVPLIISDPRKPEDQKGRTIDSFAVNLDLPSTMLALAGVDAPKTYQGFSLEPFLFGNVPSDWRTELFCEHHQFMDLIPSWYGVRGERYVYACYDRQTPPAEFLHDLKQDPDELVNLVDDPEYKSVLAIFRKRAKAYVTQYTKARNSFRSE